MKKSPFIWKKKTQKKVNIYQPTHKHLHNVEDSRTQQAKQAWSSHQYTLTQPSSWMRTSSPIQAREPRFSDVFLATHTLTHKQVIGFTNTHSQHTKGSNCKNWKISQNMIFLYQNFFFPEKTNPSRKRSNHCAKRVCVSAAITATNHNTHTYKQIWLKSKPSGEQRKTKNIFNSTDHNRKIVWKKNITLTPSCSKTKTPVASKSFRFLVNL